MSRTEQIFYYGTDDSIHSALRIKVPARVKNNLDNIDLNVEFVLDTGASGVSITASSLHLGLSEKDFIQKYNGDKIKRYGINREHPVEYYKYILDELSIGDITLYDFPVFLTFNKSDTPNLLGMPFLRLFELRIRPQFKELYLKATSETEDDIKNNISMRNVAEKYLETLIDLESIDEQTLMANIINKKLNT